MHINFEPLFDLISSRHLKQKDVWKQAHLSGSSCQKLRDNENVTTDILVRLCEALIC